MNQVRTFLLFAWLLVGFLIWEAWQRDYLVPAPAQVPTPAVVDDIGAGIPSIAVPSPADDALIPAAPDIAARGVPEAPAIERAADLAPVVVSTDLLRLTFDPRGATLIRAELLGYLQSTDADAPPVELMNPTPGRYFSAQAGWVANDVAAPSHQAVFELAAPVQDSGARAAVVEVPFVWNDPETGLTLHRTWLIERGGYVLTLRDRWSNAGGQRVVVTPYRQLLREPPPSAGGGFTNPESYSFVGAAWYTPEERFNKLKFSDFDPRQPLNVAASEGWVAMLQHYFVAAWIPEPTEASRFSTAQLDNRYLMRTVGTPLELGAGATVEHDTRLYVGPKLQETLGAVARGMERTIDYGIFTILSEPLFWLLSFFHSIVGNWGWSIVLLVILIKAVFFKLSEVQYKSFAKMRRVQPRIEALKERYGDDKAKFNAAMMELYKKEKINPMGGCLPILVQIPVFISLYWVLLESVELRHAPWFGWIQNLSAPDPYFILPALNLVTMWLTQKLSPAPGMDPMQKKMMQAMPIVFGVLFAFFPAGLVLYWTVNGALGLLQQWVITKRHGEPVKA
jgi:YidC/Oxa1 family membrane protein insertase